MLACAPFSGEGTDFGCLFCILSLFVSSVDSFVNLLVLFRTFRKDPQTLNGFITLSILEKLFKKHGLPLSEMCCDEIRDTYAVDSNRAAPILQVLYCTGE